MTCPKCKATIEADSFFCKHCGASITARGAAPASERGDRSEAPSTLASPPPGADAARDPANEKEVWHGRPSWRASVGAWLIWLLASIAAIIAAWKYSEPGNLARQLVVWGALAAAVIIAVRRALIVYGEYYRLTTQRLFVHRGIISRVTDQMELVRVDDVRLRQGLMDRVMNTGNVEVLGTDKTDQSVLLESVDEPAVVAENVRRQMRMVRSKGTLFVENI